jgi:hypothetical protein
VGTHKSQFISEVVTQGSQIFVRDAHVLLNDLAMRNTANVTDDKLIATAVSSQPVSRVNTILSRLLHSKEAEFLVSFLCVFRNMASV